MQPSIGAIVHYTLTAADADAINRRRADFEAFQRSHKHPHEPGQPGATGHQSHVGNQAREGDVCPAMVVRVFDPSATTANLQAVLDGNDTYWATSRTEGDRPGHWARPARALGVDQLARTAYDAYGASTDHKNFRGEPMPAWEELGPRIQDAWRAAARAVADAVAGE